MTKVALVLTGLSRCWEEAYPKFKEYYLDQYDVDVFINVWSERGYYSGKSYLQAPGDAYVRLAEGDKGFHTSGLITDFNALYEAYNPIAMQVLDFSKYEALIEKRVAHFDKAYTRPKNTAAQAFMAYEGMNLVSSYINQNFYPNGLDYYDMVIRARPDVVLRNDPGMIRLDGVSAIRMRNKFNQGTGDSIQWGNYSNMAFLSGMWNHLNQIYDSAGVSCPHLFITEWLKMNNIPLYEIDCGAWMAHSPTGPYQEPDSGVVIKASGT